MRVAPFLLCISLLLASGCVTRELHITTEPSGAKVTINKTYEGTSPMTMPFVHYQVFGIMIEKEGYHPLYVEEPIVAPFCEKPGIDFFTEISPMKVNDRRELHYVLQETGAADNVDDVLSRAAEMKTRLDALAAQHAEADKKRKHFTPPILNVREATKEREAIKARLESESTTEKTDVPTEPSASKEEAPASTNSEGDKASGDTE